MQTLEEKHYEETSLSLTTAAQRAAMVEDLLNGTAVDSRDS